MTESSIAKLFTESGLELIDRADALETLLEKAGIPIAPSLVLNGKKDNAVTVNFSMYSIGRKGRKWVKSYQK